MILPPLPCLTICFPVNGSATVKPNTIRLVNLTGLPVTEHDASEIDLEKREPSVGFFGSRG